MSRGGRGGQSRRRGESLLLVQATSPCGSPGATSVSMDMLLLVPAATSLHRSFVTRFCMPSFSCRMLLKQLRRSSHRGGCTGKTRVDAEWLVAVSCAALNSSTWQSLPHQKALKLLNDLSFPECCPICAEQKSSCPRFVCKSFVSKSFGSSVTQKDSWVACLVPPCCTIPGLLRRLAYKAMWADQHQDISYSPAVVEPGVTLDDKSSLSTAASNMVSEIPEETADYDSKPS